jgi:anti-anti-sigma regulatory factor
MLIKVRKNGEVVFQFNNHLDGNTARSMKMYLDYAIDLGEKRVLLDFSRVRNFEYSDMTVLVDSLLHRKKSRGIEIGLQGLSKECFDAVVDLGF